MGLLSKASLLDSTKGLAFSDFIAKYNINFFAEFELLDDNYFIVNSLGFDGISIVNSVSTQDFWNGIIHEDNKIYEFSSSDSSNPLYQFFSFNIKDDVKNISVFRNSNGKILLLCNISSSEELIEDYNQLQGPDSVINLVDFGKLINNDSYLYKLEIDFQEAIETYLLSKKIKDDCLSKNATSSIFNELSNRILYKFNHPDAGKTTENCSVKTVFVCNKKTSKELLTSHLILNFREVIENSAELTNVNFIGNIETFSELKDFLQVE